MADKKKHELVYFCRIFQWVQKQDPDFADAIKDLCMEGALSNKYGVTFLYPTDKSYRQKIIDKTYSEDANEAVRMLESLLVPIALLSGRDWDKQPVGNKCRVLFKVKVVDSGTVEIEGKEPIVLTLCSEFKKLGNNQNAVVWLVKKGTLPTSGGELYEMPKLERKAPKGKTGAGDDDNIVRILIAMSVEGQFKSCMMADRCKKYNPYIGTMISLLKFLKSKYPDVYKDILPLLDYDPIISFYLIVQPYKTTGKYFLSDDVLRDWKCTIIYKNAVEDYVGFVREGCVDAGDKVLKFQEELQGKKPQDLIDCVTKIYNEIDTSIVPNVKSLVPNQLLWQDLFRFVISMAVQNMYLSIKFNPLDWDSVVSIIKELWSGNDYVKESMLVDNVEVQKNITMVRIPLLLFVKFINSESFIYVCRDYSSVNAKDSQSFGSLNPRDVTIYKSSLKSYVMLCNNNSEMLRSDGLSDRVLRELKQYKEEYGKLPDI